MLRLLLKGEEGGEKRGTIKMAPRVRDYPATKK
jgi:hypothetical protein